MKSKIVSINVITAPQDDSLMDYLDIIGELKIGWFYFNLDDMVKEGIVILSDVNVIKYTHRDSETVY